MILVPSKNELPGNQWLSLIGLRNARGSQVPINVVLTFFLRIAFFLCHVSFISAARTTDHNRPQMTTNDPTFLLFKLDGLQYSTNLHGEMGRVESFGYCTGRYQITLRRAASAGLPTKLLFVRSDNGLAPYRIVISACCSFFGDG
jgi:hypothetical protein